jgi:hypothetical protein
LISKIESTQESPQGPIQITFEFSSFEPYGTVKLPIIITQTTPFFIVESSNMFYVNEPIDDSKFIPEKANK